MVICFNSALIWPKIKFYVVIAMAYNLMKNHNHSFHVDIIVDHRHCDTVQFQNGVQLILRVCNLQVLT